MIDMDVVASPAFVILCLMALGATALGYVFSVRSELIAIPIWQLLVIMGVEVVACYIFAAKG